MTRTVPLPFRPMSGLSMATEFKILRQPDKMYKVTSDRQTFHPGRGIEEGGGGEGQYFLSPHTTYAPNRPN